MGFAIDFLAECLQAQGLPADKAKAAAEYVMQSQITIGLLKPHHVERWECEAKVYHLRIRKVEAFELSMRFNTTERAVYRMVQRHLVRIQKWKMIA